MNNSAVSFRQTVISFLHGNGFVVFGGAVRDILSGDFFSSDWSGDIDVRGYNKNVLSNLLLDLLQPKSDLRIVSAESITNNLTRLVITDRELNHKVQVDVVIGELSSYNYGCGFEEETERDFLDLDVNGLTLSVVGIGVMPNAHTQGVSVLGAITNIKNKRFKVLKALTDKRIEKMRKLEAAGWVQIF